MKRAFMAAAALAAALSAAPALGQPAADEMPVRAACTDGRNKVVFRGVAQPLTDPQTGQFGLSYFWMDIDSYNTMFRPVVHIVPGARAEKNGLQPADIGNLPVSVKIDDVQNLAVIRGATGNLRDALNIYLPQWKCDIQPQP